MPRPARSALVQRKSKALKLDILLGSEIRAANIYRLSWPLGSPFALASRMRMQVRKMFFPATLRLLFFWVVKPCGIKFRG